VIFPLIQQLHYYDDLNNSTLLQSTSMMMTMMMMSTIPSDHFALLPAANVSEDGHLQHCKPVER